jgi:hypothetical protein
VNPPARPWGTGGIGRIGPIWLEAGKVGPASTGAVAARADHRTTARPRGLTSRMRRNLTVGDHTATRSTKMEIAPRPSARAPGRPDPNGTPRIGRSIASCDDQTTHRELHGEVE